MKLRLFICLLASLLLIPHLHGDDKPKTEVPATIKAAEETYKLAKDNAQADFETKRKPLEVERAVKLSTARKAYVLAIENAAKDAMRTGDLPRANQLNELKQVVADMPEADAEPHNASQPDPGQITGGPHAGSSSSPVYLCTLEHFEVVANYGQFGKGGLFGDAKVIVDGKFSPHGIGIHPIAGDYAKVQFHLDGKYSKFVAGVALNDSCGGIDKGHLVFEVLGDGKSLWKGAPIEKWKTIYPCAVNVRGVKTLELRVNCPGSSDYQHAAWLEPQLFH